MQVNMSIEEFELINNELRKKDELIKGLQESGKRSFIYWSGELNELNKIKFAVIEFFKKNNVLCEEAIGQCDHVLTKLPQLAEELFNLTKDSFIAECYCCGEEDLLNNMRECEFCEELFCSDCDDMNYGKCEICNDNNW